MKSDIWFYDYATSDHVMLHRIKEHLYSVQTRYQRVDLLDTHHFGRILVLDNKIQSAESDEHIYHEVLVHPAMASHPNPERVLILGGGEGATLREVLKHNTVKQAVMVDIDRELVAFAKKHMKKWHRGAFSDKRAKLVFADAVQYVKKAKERFDVIICDINDPTAGGPAAMIYTKEFYALLLKRLAPQGVFVTQGTEVFFDRPAAYSMIYRTVASVFALTESFVEFVPSFTCLWGFVSGTKGQLIKGLPVLEVKKRLRQRKVRTRFYGPETHERLFSLNNLMAPMLEKQKAISTMADPVSVFPGGAAKASL